MIDVPLRVSYPTWTMAVRAIATIFNSHNHDPYSRTSAAVTTSTTLDFSAHTVSVTVTGQTITLPKALASIIGMEWTVHLAVAGTVTIARQSTDTIYTPYSATDTSVQLITLGDSVTLRCLTATTWGLV